MPRTFASCHLCRGTFTVDPADLGTVRACPVCRRQITIQLDQVLADRVDPEWQARGTGAKLVARPEPPRTPFQMGFQFAAGCLVFLLVACFSLYAALAVLSRVTAPGG